MSAISTMLQPFTIIYTTPDMPGMWKFHNCDCVDAEQAEVLFEEANPEWSLLWINDGHDNYSMEEPGQEENEDKE